MELTAIVSVVAAISGVIVAWLTFGRNTNKDARSSGADSASIHSDIEYIKRGIDDIKLEQRSMRNDVTKIDITSWALLGRTLLDAIGNPYVIITALVALWNAVTDPTTAGIGDSVNALTYTEPKKREIG